MSAVKLYLRLETDKSRILPAVAQIFWRQNQNDHRNAFHTAKEGGSRDTLSDRQESESVQEKRLKNAEKGYKSRTSSRPAPSQMTSFQAYPNA